MIVYIPQSIFFKALTIFIQFNRYIEKGNLQSARDCMFQNPRYLVSSGETPVILQEGSRYNAMHVAAKANEVQMCHLIVSTLNDGKFWDLMFPNQEGTELSLRRAERMLDYYVNSPDKGVSTVNHCLISYCLSIFYPLHKVFSNFVNEK